MSEQKLYRKEYETTSVYVKKDGTRTVKTRKRYSMLKYPPDYSQKRKDATTSVIKALYDANVKVNYKNYLEWYPKVVTEHETIPPFSKSSYEKVRATLGFKPNALKSEDELTEETASNEQNE